MGDPQRELIVLPHISVQSELELGKYLLISSNELTRIPKKYHPHVQLSATLYCAVGYEIKDIGLLVRNSGRSRLTVLSAEERQEVQNVIDVLAFSSSYQERAALSLTRDNFGFTIWSFRGDKPPSDHINLSTRRYNFHVVENKQHLIQIPLHVHYTRFDSNGYDSEVLTALLPCAYSKRNEDRRIMRAIHWFNHVHTNSGEVTDYSRFAMTGIAYETMLDMPYENVRKYFVSAIQELLGESDELKRWARKFYDNRSKLVHGGGMPDLIYGKHKHNSMLYLADIVFIQCVFRHLGLLGYWKSDVVESVRQKNVVKYLISNKERFTAILKFRLRDDEEKTSLVHKYLYTIQRSDASVDLNECNKVFAHILNMGIEGMKNIRRHRGFKTERRLKYVVAYKDIFENILEELSKNGDKYINVYQHIKGVPNEDDHFSDSYVRGEPFGKTKMISLDLLISALYDLEYLRGIRPI